MSFNDVAADLNWSSYNMDRIHSQMKLTHHAIIYNKMHETISLNLDCLCFPALGQHTARTNTTPVDKLFFEKL